MASKQGSSAVKSKAVAVLDPTYDWVDGDGIYLLRLTLPGFKKEDFRVHVDPAGRLTILGHGAGGATRVHKVFQLPSTSDLDGITGRYDGCVLALTVPKLPPPPPPPQEQDKQEDLDQDPAGKATGQHKSRISREAERLIEAARARLPRTRQAKEQSTAGRSEMPAPAPKEVEEEPKPKPKAEAPADRKGQDEKAKGTTAAADDEQRAKVVGREAERGIEAARARLQAAAERETAERQQKKSCCWKEEGLKWADAIGNNKEVIATAVAAFTLGVFVSHRLFARN